jgi:ferritin
MLQIGGKHMISNDMAARMCVQMNMELFSAYFYLALSSRAESGSLKGISDWFMAKHYEEQAHAMKIYRYLMDQDVKVELQPVNAPPEGDLSVLEMIETTLAHEREVTAAINGLVDHALSEKDHATNIFLQWFITEQIEEEATVGEILGRLRLFGDKPEGLLMLDKELGGIAATMAQAGAAGPTVGSA